MAKDSTITEIVLTANTSILFGDTEQTQGNLLFIGNFNGVCGDVIWKGHNNPENRLLSESDWSRYSDTIYNNINVIINTIKNGYYIIFAGSNDSIRYWKHFIYYLAETGVLTNDKLDKASLKKVLNHFKTINTNPIYENAARLYNNEVNTKLSDMELHNRIKEFAMNNIFGEIEKCNMKFKNIIQNPPYNGSLHLDFFERGLDLLEEGGRMVIVEPATWLINVRKNGKAKKYDEIKKKIDGHVESIVIENLNKEFNTGLYVPFATTVIDMSKTFDTIDCNICGEHKTVKSIYDCNLIGEYETIWSILNKVQSFDDMMKSHITNEDLGNNMWYAKYDEILPNGNIEPANGNKNLGTSCSYSREVNYIELHNNSFLYKYIQSCFNKFVDITDYIPKKLKGGSNYNNPKYSDSNADCVYGTKEEIENWKHFIFNNKLSLFINIVMTIDQNNNSKEFLPWLVDKQYTNDEINKKFNFTEEEIALIDKTLKKFERYSPWFKRYMCGKNSVEEEELNKFIEEISEDYA